MINYLEKGTLPKLQKEARRLLVKVPEYCIMDQLLFHSRLAKSKRTQHMGEFQLVIPKILIPNILELLHESPLAGHMGIQKQWTLYLNISISKTCHQLCPIWFERDTTVRRGK